MNILFYLTRYPGIGGIENVTNIIGRELSKEHSISIISHVQQENINGIDVFTIYCMPNNNNWNAKENYNYVDKIVTENHFDAVIYQDSYAPTEHIACTIAQNHNIPLYVFEHNSPLFIFNKRDLDPIITPKGFLRRVLHPILLHREIKRKRYLLEHAKKYVLLSNQFIPEFCNLIGADKNDKRITYMYNPALPVKVETIIKKDNIILCVSRLAREKCVDKMIRMWGHLAPQLHDWKFIIVGDGPEKPKLESLVRTLNVPRVEFTGFATPAEYYQRSKIFWMTSKFEGWGMTLIEAMQQGCVPVAFQSFSSVKDIIDSGRNGYLIEPNNLPRFEQITILLAQNEAQRSIMADLCKKKIDDFSINKVIFNWNNLLNNA